MDRCHLQLSHHQIFQSKTSEVSSEDYILHSILIKEYFNKNQYPSTTSISQW